MRVPIVLATIFSMTMVPAIPSAVAGPAPAPSKVYLQNVELSSSGIVDGHILDDKGTPLAGSKIKIRTKAGEQEVTTDTNGRFKLASKVGGNCA
ncbi:MAG: hypothetical protein ABGZ53_00395, partial [Fuerstiella sp.]